jgi:probable HAF family extracellular repeat protein
MKTWTNWGLALGGLTLSVAAQAGTPYSAEKVMNPVDGLQAGHGSQVEWAGKLAVSDAGQVLGTQVMAGVPMGNAQAFLQDGLGVRTIPTLPAYTNGELLGTAGKWAAGSVYNLGTDPMTATRAKGQAMLLDLDTGNKRVLGTLGGLSSQGLDVNAQGVVVGHSWVAGNDHVTAFVTDNGRMKPLFADQRISVARVINDRGDIAGQMGDLNSGGATWGWGVTPGRSPWADGGRPFLISQGQTIMLDEVLGRGNQPGQTEVTDMNNAGAVLLDRSFDPLGTSVVVQDGMVRVLDSLVLAPELQAMEGERAPTRNAFTHALDINDRGQVVGWSMKGLYEQRAVMWNGTEVIDLNDLLLNPGDISLTAAWAIDNDGTIWAQGSDMAIYRLSAVPEPGTAASLMLGLGGMALVLQRRGRRQAMVKGASA